LKQLNQDVYDDVSRALSIIYMPLLMLGKIADPNMLPTPSMIQIFSDVAMDLSSDQQLVIHSTSLHFMAENRLGDLHTFAFSLRHVPDTQGIVALHKEDTGRELTIP
jgi:esterase/lipase